jgi:hypothetical protein
MQLKKNIDEQMASLKTMQDQLVRVSAERDNAIEECRQMKLAVKHSATSGKVSSSRSVSHAESQELSTGDDCGKKKTASGSTRIVTRRRALMEANHADLSETQPELEL